MYFLLYYNIWLKYFYVDMGFIAQQEQGRRRETGSISTQTEQKFSNNRLNFQILAGFYAQGY